MRLLAHVEKVVALDPIPKADFVETATILGWQCVVAKGIHKVGDLVVFIEVDSIVPNHEIFDFMAPRKWRVRTIKLRKQISQGLVIPLEELDRFKQDYSHKVLEGDDVTDVIGIIKYDPQAKKENKLRAIENRNPIVEYLMSFQWFRTIRAEMGFGRLRNFPTFITKTDETRIQNLPHIFRIWENEEMFGAEKLDGQSATYAIYKDEKYKLWNWLKRSTDFIVCSRNLRLHKENKSTWWRIARQLDIENKLRKIGKNIAIQGEIIGESVQDNKYKIKGLDFYIFNVYDIDEQKKYNLFEKQDFCEIHGFKIIPHRHTLTLNQDMTVKDMVELSKGKSTINPKIMREGIVLRSFDEDKSFKAINPEFLLKYNDE